MLVCLSHLEVICFLRPTNENYSTKTYIGLLEIWCCVRKSKFQCCSDSTKPATAKNNVEKRQNEGKKSVKSWKPVYSDVTIVANINTY